MSAPQHADQTPDLLPRRFAAWFADRGWRPRRHQLDLLAHGLANRPALLIAPTGAGKTLAGFLPTLVDCADPDRPRQAGLHTLYISPLKALAVDVARNLIEPAGELALDVAIETRTGDTPPQRRQRQNLHPPDILLATPEQCALMLANRQAPRLFKGLKRIVLDELHALAPNKRGALLSLGLARLKAFAPDAVATGLSATVSDTDELRAFLVPDSLNGDAKPANLVIGEAGADPHLEILASKDRVPWSGHSARYALDDLYQVIKAHRTVLLFVNTRSQAELIFQELWRINDDALAIALHHGSLDKTQRRKVEAAMVRGELRAVVATSTLDLGVDWGDVDLVVNIGAPKGASRLAQRIGRANHKLDQPSRALLVPANRFEVLECQAARRAVVEKQQDTAPMLRAPLDVLAQHIMGLAVAGPFAADQAYREVTSAAPYGDLTRETFDQVLEFVATGGYALRRYDRYARLKQTPEGLYRLAHPRLAQNYRMNIGTIVEAPKLKVRLVKSRARVRPQALRGRILGEIEEGFIDHLGLGDTFVFGGEILRFEGLVETDVIVTRSNADTPKVPAYMGGKFPLSTYLAARVRAMLARPQSWHNLPDQVRQWLKLQQAKSRLPKPDGLLVETFPRADKYYLVCYPFEGRLAHQTLGFLLTRRLERARARPMGFVANEYALAVWGLRNLSAMIRENTLSLGKLFDRDMLGDDLDAWLKESALMKNTFRNCAVIAGLIERRFPGQEKTGRQVTFSADLIYDVLREHEPDHVLLRAAWDDAATGLLDLARLQGLLDRAHGRIDHNPLDRISPLAVPVMLEIGREPVYGEANEDLMAELAEDLLDEATRLI
jgi:ATP-dependent Lhr-like helicase